MLAVSLGDRHACWHEAGMVCKSHSCVKSGDDMRTISRNLDALLCCNPSFSVLLQHLPRVPSRNESAPFGPTPPSTLRKGRERQELWYSNEHADASFLSQDHTALTPLPQRLLSRAHPPHPCNFQALAHPSKCLQCGQQQQSAWSRRRKTTGPSVSLRTTPRNTHTRVLRVPFWNTGTQL